MCRVDHHCGFPQSDCPCITSPYIYRRLQNRPRGSTWCTIRLAWCEKQMSASRPIFVVPVAVSVWMVTCGVSTAQRLPTTEQFHDALATCATGLNITITTDLIGSISSIYNGERSSGATNFRTETQFLQLFAEADRPKVYELYTKCISAILPKAAGSNMGSVNSAGSANTTLIGQITKLIEFPDNHQIPAPTLHQRGFKDKFPQRLFELLIQYDEQQVLAVDESRAIPATPQSEAGIWNSAELHVLGQLMGTPGEKLLQFRKDYYDLQSKVEQIEDKVLLRIGKLMSNKSKFRDEWEVYLSYADARFDGVSQAEIIAYNGSGKLGTNITWDDAEKVFAELSRDPQIAYEMYTIPRSHLKMIGEATQAASSVQQATKQDEDE